MNKNEIYIKSGTDYKEMTKELLAQCGLASVIQIKRCRLVSSLILYRLPRLHGGATTHPEIVAGNY